MDNYNNAKENLVPRIILMSKCDKEYEQELYESTFNHSSDTLWRPFTRDRRRNEKSLSYWTGTAVMEEEKPKNKDYDYEMMQEGIGFIVVGLLMLVAVYNIVGLSEKIDTNFLEKTYTTIRNVAFGVISSLAIGIGVSFILKPTQKMYQKWDWKRSKTRFRYKWGDLSVTGHTLDNGTEGIKNVNEMILYDKYAQFYSQGTANTLNYEYMECIFETNNLFVVMVRNNDIYSFQKCDMTYEEQEMVRKILTPYYERGYKPEVSTNQLFRDM